MHGSKYIEWFPLGFIEDSFPYEGVEYDFLDEDPLHHRALIRLMRGLQERRFYLEPKDPSRETPIRCVRGTKPFFDLNEVGLDVPLLLSSKNSDSYLKQLTEQFWDAIRPYLSGTRFYMHRHHPYRQTCHYTFEGEPVKGLCLREPKLAISATF